MCVYVVKMTLCTKAFRTIFGSAQTHTCIHEHKHTHTHSKHKNAWGERAISILQLQSIPRIRTKEAAIKWVHTFRSLLIMTTTTTTMMMLLYCCLGIELHWTEIVLKYLRRHAWCVWARLCVLVHECMLYIRSISLSKMPKLGYYYHYYHYYNLD